MRLLCAGTWVSVDFTFLMFCSMLGACFVVKSSSIAGTFGIAGLLAVASRQQMPHQPLAVQVAAASAVRTATL